MKHVYPVHSPFCPVALMKKAYREVFTTDLPPVYPLSKGDVVTLEDDTIALYVGIKGVPCPQNQDLISYTITLQPYHDDVTIDWICHVYAKDMRPFGIMSGRTILLSNTSYTTEQILVRQSQLDLRIRILIRVFSPIQVSPSMKRKQSFLPQASPPQMEDNASATSTLNDG